MTLTPLTATPLTAWNDLRLLRRLRAGEQAAFETVVRLHYESVWHQQFLLCGCRELAADLTQETFLQAWRALPTFAGRASLRTWLYTIAVRVWQRALAKQQRGGAPLATTLLSEQLDAVPDRAAVVPERAAGQALLAESVTCALLRLPPAQREIIVLCYRQHLSHAEAARALQIPLGTVKSRLHEGLKHLRRLLGSLEETL
jgi:RNA polymerase sigma-70 factor, ECF subfamily